MPTFSGRLLLADDVLEGTLEVEGGRVLDWREGELERHATATGWIVPSPVNAHTHVADASLRGRPGKPATVAELVGPGGWKARHLAEAKPEDLRAGIVRYTEEMAAIGTAAFIDFREGGVAGVQALRDLEAAGDLAVRPVVLGRPARLGFDPEEAAALLRAADGIGLSARRDFPDPAHVEDWAEAARKARKPFALHASEAHEEDLDAVAALEPAFLVHCTRATKAQLATLGDLGIPVVVCPRSNAFYGMKTPLDRLLAAGVRVAVGTDNGMLATGDLLADLGQLHSWFPAVPTAELLRMATLNARGLAGLPATLPTRLPPREGDAADFIVLPKDPLAKSATHRPGFVVPTALPEGPAAARPAPEAR